MAPTVKVPNIVICVPLSNFRGTVNSLSVENSFAVNVIVRMESNSLKAFPSKAALTLTKTLSEAAVFQKEAANPVKKKSLSVGVVKTGSVPELVVVVFLDIFTILRGLML